MDTWSRPSKTTATPPPLYVTHPGTPYCHTCGRVNNTRRKPPSGANNASSSSGRGGPENAALQPQAKFCSERCKRRKPTTELDRKIESVLRHLLMGLDPGAAFGAGPVAGGVKTKKGDASILVRLSEVEAFVFEDQRGDAEDSRREKSHGKTKKRGVPDADVWQSVDMEEGWLDKRRKEPKSGLDLGFTDEESGESENDFEEGGVQIGNRASSKSVPDEGGETDEMLLKRREGQKKAEEREQVRQAARRAVVFGLEVPQIHRTEIPKKKGKKKDAEQAEEQPGTIMRKCEAVMKCGVVDPSFAKGDWSIRWRDE